MRTALLETEGALRIIEAEKPLIQDPDQVLMQVKTVGVCGSEVHAFEGTHPYRKAPVVLGHEMAGVVAEVGEAVTEFRAGDRAIVDPQWTCGACIFCQAGNINLCPSKRILGTTRWPGAFGEYVTVPQELVFHLPDHLSYAQGSLIEPLAVAVHSVGRARLKAGETAVILGTGSIGNLLAGVCHVEGIEPLIVADVRKHCLDVARDRLGATHAFLLPDDHLVDKIKAMTGDEGVDVVFVSADDASLVRLALDTTRRRGRIVLVALQTKAPLHLEAYPIISKELHIVGSVTSTRDEMQRAIEMAASGEVDVESILTHVLPIEEAQRGLELAQTKADGAIKVVLSFS